jgi:GNAT superfamily N-acetyltransferase
MEQAVTTTHLEMTSARDLRPAAPVAGVSLTVVRAEIPCPEMNRFLYTAVGADWVWYSRLSWDYVRWLSYLSRPELETWVAYVSGTPAGYFELERQGPDVELAYFGLLPAFVGRGIGAALLTTAVRRAWELNPNRVWVHTCDLDHWAACRNYERCGFRIFKRDTAIESLPSLPLEPWPGANRAPVLPRRAIE